jgi:hypothetical protein
MNNEWARRCLINEKAASKNEMMLAANALQIKITNTGNPGE